MAEIIKTIEEIEDIFRVLVLNILKLDPSKSHKRIRFPWGSDLKYSGNTAPYWNRDDDVCTITLLPQDDSYNRNRDRKYIDKGGRDLIQVEEHTDVHHVLFANYGPNAYECARDIRDGLFREDVRRYLKQNNFSLVTDVPSILRIPELVNGEWWNRVDCSAVFNEYVRRETPINAIEEINIKAIEISQSKEIIGESITKNTD